MFFYVFDVFDVFCFCFVRESFVAQLPKQVIRLEDTPVRCIHAEKGVIMIGVKAQVRYIDERVASRCASACSFSVCVECCVTCLLYVADGRRDGGLRATGQTCARGRFFCQVRLDLRRLQLRVSRALFLLT